MRPDEWVPHYNEGDYAGQWRGAGLRSASGSTGDLSARSPDGSAFRDTPLLDRCPYFREVLSSFPCPLKAVRLLGLAPGSFIREHCDHALDYEDGEVRIHIPVQTNPEVEFYVAGERLKLEEGRSYYVNVNAPHRVTNGGTTERIHLVIDAEVDSWIHALFERARGENWQITRYSVLARGFAEFHDLVVESPELRQKLLSAEDRHELLRRAVELGSEMGFRFTEADVGSSIRREKPEPTGSPEGWTPVKVFFRDRTAWAEWIWAGAMRFTEPFFDDSVRIARRHPFTAVFRREMPLEVAERIPALATEKAPETSGAGGT